ncbi:uncharacterized protein GGS22DRAFT_159768 [Annulohypoxylon maeteangense]|uniref:uncharacterized protein n=1 Tax=Annulohypoxylon maeteangense TaxID=1927788 RepID=UPI00200792C9|nr:uncharacterized protein GGS22DRAFT_159768 [Annulohypoxylon maeteangense]KAI0886066.1 hypothetical protein GGS22DRAFT_159768 [Annulohypoxylon maeteangense]
MASPARDRMPPLTLLAPVQHVSRSYEPRNGPRIIVEPTQENQRIYNDIRQTHERMRLQTHVASQQNPVPPPSTLSVSTVHSPIDDPETTSTQDVPAQDTDRPRRPRGKRRGPLKNDTRLHTALKRKLKLACPHHRAKKITCDCHDFSKLEEGYPSFTLPPSPNRGRSHDHNVNLPLTPVEQTLNRETFGAGGAAMTPSDQDGITNDIDLQSPFGDHEGVIRSDVRQIVTGFNTASVYLDSTMLQAPGLPYHPGNDIGSQSPREHSQEDLLEIGSQMPAYPNRWQCEYKGSPDTASETSSEFCPWSGPFRDLSWHFKTAHHPFYDASPRFWIVCTRCHAKSRATDDLESPLPSPGCSRYHCSGPYRRWYYGSTREESTLGSAVALTHSDESEAGFSCNLQLEGNQLWLGGEDPIGGPMAYFGAGSSYERPHSYGDKWDTSTDTSDPSSSCSHLSLDDVRIRSRKDCVQWHPSDMRMKMFNSVCQPRRSPFQYPIRLSPFAKLPIGHLLSIILPLVTTIIRESGYFTERTPSTIRTIDSDVISWWSLLSLLIGFATTWTIKDRARYWAIDDSKCRAHGRHHPKNRYPFAEPSRWRRFGALITA